VKGARLFRYSVGRRRRTPTGISQETEMSELSEKHCTPCKGGVEPLSPNEAQQMMKQLHSEWLLAADGRNIARNWKFKNFLRTMSFVNAAAHIVNIEDHHPDLTIGYDHCRIQFTTHAIDGLSENDFICAARIDAIPV
jgi:4a-hydroxytetrahydrobiopterin dehydratase